MIFLKAYFTITALKFAYCNANTNVYMNKNETFLFNIFYVKRSGIYSDMLQFSFHILYIH